MHEGLSILTGFPCIQVEIDSDDHDSVFVDTLWAKLYSALESNYLIGASCGAGKLPVDEKQYRGLGLMAQHAYSVLNVATISNDRLIQLRNPWGTFVWSGVYGPHWLKSQTDLRRQLEPNGTSSGTFWMPFQCCKF
jgi:calpain-15